MELFGTIWSWHHRKSLLFSLTHPLLSLSCTLYLIISHLPSYVSLTLIFIFAPFSSELKKRHVSYSHLIPLAVHLSPSHVSSSYHPSFLSSSSLLLDDTRWVPHYSPLSFHLTFSSLVSLSLPLIFCQHFDTACLQFYLFGLPLTPFSSPLLSPPLHSWLPSPLTLFFVFAPTLFSSLFSTFVFHTFSPHTSPSPFKTLSLSFFSLLLLN